MSKVPRNTAEAAIVGGSLMIVLMMMMTTTTMIIRDDDIIITIMMLVIILMNMLQAISFCTIIRPYDHEIFWNFSYAHTVFVFQFSSSVCSVRLRFAPCVHNVLLRLLSRVRHNLLRVFVEASAVHLHPMFAYVTRKKLHTCTSAPLNPALLQPYLRAGRARADPFFSAKRSDCASFF